VNEGHLQVCGSDEWAEVLRDHVVPWVLDGLGVSGSGSETSVLRAVGQVVVEVA